MRLGLDFGTTNCTVGHLRKEGGRSIHPLIPSIGAWHNGQLEFGQQAREMLRSDRRDVHPIRDLKLMLGTGHKLVFGQTVVDPEEVAADLLRYLIRVGAAEEEVEDAVIGTPVQISLQNRQALRRAAASAGLHNVRYVYEPTAALIGAQRFSPPDRGGLVLVVDWGGGTLDIAVVRTDGTRFEELAVGGDVAELGGTRIDGEICRFVLAADDRLRQAVDELPEGRERLKDEIEQMKLEIIGSLEGPDGPPEEHAPPWLPRAIIRLERKWVFDALASFADRAAKTIREKLELARIPAPQITSVLFAGGVCRADTIRDRLIREFPNARALTTVAGTGEPLQLQELTGAGCVEITRREVFIELAAGLGVRQSDGSVCVLLPRGFPVRVNTYRKAEFVVTDPITREAVIDLGLVHGENGSVNMLGLNSDSFESLRQIFVPVAQYVTRDARPVLDYVELRIGVDRDLAVTVCASSKMAQRTQTAHQTGIPMILSFRD
jgi:hypothetical protein